MAKADSQGRIKTYQGPARERPDDEAFNIQSLERAALLVQIGQSLGKTKVKAVFWACLQVVDLKKLEIFVNPNLVNVFEHFEDLAQIIPDIWTERAGHSGLVANGASSAISSERTNSSRSRLRRERDLASERDGAVCVLTQSEHSSVAYMIDPSSFTKANEVTNSQANKVDVWKLMKNFWEPEKVDRWRRQIYKNEDRPNLANDSCNNIICLRKDLHAAWTNGVFALRPVSISEDQRELKVQFFWQRRVRHKPTDEVDLLVWPQSTEDCDRFGKTPLLLIDRDDNPVLVRSGDMFTLTTRDPATHPLPNFDLLEMQWYLARIVAMSGVANVSESEREGREVPWLLQQRVEDWLDSGLSPMFTPR